MLKIYGSPLCPDCVKCKEELEAAGAGGEGEAAHREGLREGLEGIFRGQCGKAAEAGDDGRHRADGHGGDARKSSRTGTGQELGREDFSGESDRLKG